MRKRQYQLMGQLRWIFASQLLFITPFFGDQVFGDQIFVDHESTWEAPTLYSSGYDEEWVFGCEERSDHSAFLGLNDPVPTNIDPEQKIYESPHLTGLWLPDDPVLFRPFMADPREITFSTGWRFDDNALGQNVIDVSFGDSAAIYRWLDVWPWHGELQVEVEGALWAVFNPLHESSPLVNADYYGGIPITYAFDNWAFRLRFFHISSHLGDEFLMNHPGYDRRNASAEYVDFFISNDFTEEIRLFAGLGYIVAQDKEYKMSPFYSALGAELRMLRLGFINEAEELYGCPIYGMYFRQNGDYKRHIDSTFVLGYEFGKMAGIYRKLRFYMEYHDGYSVEGQFSKIPTNYFSVRTSYGF